MDQLQPTHDRYGNGLSGHWSSSATNSSSKKGKMFNNKETEDPTIAQLAKQSGRSIPDTIEYLRIVGYQGSIKKNAQVGPPGFVASVLHLLPSWQSS